MTPNKQYPAPVLLSPPDGQAFSFGDEIALEWQSVGSLGMDEFYVITVAYAPASDPHLTWYDETPWIKDTVWALSEHAYLPGLSADGLFRWSVQVMYRTGLDSEEHPTGTALSPSSEERMLAWKTASGGTSGGDGGGQDEQPAPLPPQDTPKPPPP